MKQISFVLVLLLNFAGHAQQDSLKKHVIVIDVNARMGNVNNYYLQSFSDTSLSLSRQPIVYGTANVSADRIINYQDIQTITYRRRGATGRTILAGAGIGILTGAVIGLASGDDPPGTWFRFSAGEKAVALGVFLGITGTVVGTIAGLLSNKRFAILGEQNRFQDFKRFVFSKSHKMLPVNY